MFLTRYKGKTKVLAVVGPEKIKAVEKAASQLIILYELERKIAGFREKPSGDVNLIYPSQGVIDAPRIVCCAIYYASVLNKMPLDPKALSNAMSLKHTTVLQSRSILISIVEAILYRTGFKTHNPHIKDSTKTRPMRVVQIATQHFETIKQSASQILSTKCGISTKDRSSNKVI